jgi:cell division protein FtsW (lipid II flippase)
MPNDVKAAVSAITLAVALILAFWSGSPIRHDFASFVVIVAVFMIAAMWVFPEAGGKKRGSKETDLNGTKASQ